MPIFGGSIGEKTPNSAPGGVRTLSKTFEFPNFVLSTPSTYRGRKNTIYGSPNENKILERTGVGAGRGKKIAAAQEKKREM